MVLGRRIRRNIRNRIGPTGTRWIETARVNWAQARWGWARFPRECNICGFKGKFYPLGPPWGLQVRLDAGCPQCRSQDRHRLFKLWFDANETAFANKSVLHFAPDRPLRWFVPQAAAEYLTADIDPGADADRCIDIEAIDLPENRFDAIICSHVIEHVDDRKALAEMYRVLRPGGVLVLMAPYIAGWPTTYENPAITDSDERFLHFGQSDHLRYYGADLIDRISSAGFSVKTCVATEPHVSTLGLARGTTLFICR